MADARQRGLGVRLRTAAARIGSGATTRLKRFPNCRNRVDVRPVTVFPAFAFFGCMTLLQFFFALYLMPETKGGTIEQMEKELVGSSEGSK